jgi:hypothetical protein
MKVEMPTKTGQTACFHLETKKREVGSTFVLVLRAIMEDWWKELPAPQYCSKQIWVPVNIEREREKIGVPVKVKGFEL